MSKPILKHFASLWTLMDYPNGSASGEWTICRDRLGDSSKQPAFPQR